MVEGTPLGARLGKPFEIPAFLRIAEDCAQAIAAAAEEGIVHSDLKPTSILVTADGHAKILDFGLARRTVDDSQVRATTVPVMGTPRYLAPEVISGRVPDFRSDVFSLGVIFYEMLTGVNPFRRSTLAETFASILSEHPSPPEESNPRVPAELGRVVLRMLAKDPGLRYATPADLLDDFRQAVEGASVAIARSAGRRARVVALLVAAVVLIAALLLVMWVAERSPR